jgi:hypothetical protein
MTGADTWLRALNTYWTPTASQFAGARSHRATIEARLKSEVGIYGMFEIGSLRHGTGVWQVSDADYLVSLHGVRPASQWTALNKVKTALQGRFPSTTITVRQPAVVCSFADGPVEVVPGFYSDSGYWIPDPTGTWMKTYPSEHNKYVNEVNNRLDGGAKALARQLKTWKYRRAVPVSSCYLEMRAARYLADEKIYSPLLDLKNALLHLQSAQLRALNDPTGLGSRFTAYSPDSKRDDALSKLDRAVGRVLKARDFDIAGDDTNAIAQLQLLFDHNL